MTLEYVDAEKEARYAAKRFADAYGSFVIFLGVLMLLTMLQTIVSPEVGDQSALIFVMLFVIICVRVWCHRLEDQERARLLFGRVWLGITTTCWLGAVPWVHPPARAGRSWPIRDSCRNVGLHTHLFKV